MTDVINDEKKDSKYIYAVYPARTGNKAKDEEISVSFTNAMRCTEGAWNQMVQMKDREGHPIQKKNDDGSLKVDKKGQAVYVERLVTFIPKNSLETAHPDLKLGQIFTSFKDVWKKAENRTSNLSEDALASLGTKYDNNHGLEVAAAKKARAAEIYKERRENAKAKQATDELAQTETQGRSR